MDEVYGPRSAMVSAQAWEVGKLKAEVLRLQMALADATERAEAAEGYIVKIEAIRGKNLGVPCCCDFADDDNETPIVECGYHRAVREERDAAIARADALAAGIAAVQALIHDSEGVAGLHLNGDVAPWCDLLEGGNLEEWLLDFSRAARLAEVEG